MKKTKKMIKNFILFIILIILTFSIILKDANMVDIFYAFISAKKSFILVAIICMFLYLACEAINIGRTLKALGEKSNFLMNLKYEFCNEVAETNTTYIIRVNRHLTCVKNKKTTRSTGSFD